MHVLFLLKDELSLQTLQFLLLLLLLVLESVLDYGAQAALAKAPRQLEVAAVAHASLAARRRRISADWKETAWELRTERGIIDATLGTLSGPFSKWFSHTVIDLNALRRCAQLHRLVLQYSPGICLLIISLGLTRLRSLQSIKLIEEILIKVRDRSVSCLLSSVHGVARGRQRHLEFLRALAITISEIWTG